MALRPSASEPQARPATPWHLWLVGVFGVLWNGVGVVDNLMIQTANESYLAGLTPEQVGILTALPLWLAAAWSVAVWGGAVGCLLLLARHRVAASVLLVSLAAMTVTGAHNFVADDGIYETGGTSPGFVLVIFLLACAFWMYARAFGRRGEPASAA